MRQPGQLFQPRVGHPGIVEVLVEVLVEVQRVQLCQLRSMRKPTSAAPISDEEVATALSHLERFEQILSDPTARAAVCEMVSQLNLRVGLRFVPAIKGKKRMVRKLLGAMIVFGNNELPVPLHGRDRRDGDPADCQDKWGGNPEKQARERSQTNCQKKQQSQTREGQTQPKNR